MHKIPWWTYALGATAVSGAGVLVWQLTRPESTPRPVRASGEPNPSDSIRLGEGCTVASHTPCDYKVAIGVAYDVAEEAQLPTATSLQAIIARGSVTPRQAQRVLRRWADEVRTAPTPDPQHMMWADAVLQYTSLEEATP